MIARFLILILAIAFIFSSVPFVFIYGLEFVLSDELATSLGFGVLGIFYYLLALPAFYFSVNARNLDYRIFGKKFSNNQFIPHLPLIIVTMFQYGFWLWHYET